MCKPLGPFRPRSYAYNGDGNVIDMKAYSGVSANQETTYGYGVNPSNGSSITSNDLLYAVQYPDLSTGAASMYQQESYAYDAAGETTFSMDRNASTHVYSYDVLGRLTQDLANYGGTNAYHVDMTVDRLVYAYDSAGRLASVKSKNGSSVVNETDRTYNGFGQVVEEDQPNGSVEYSYSTPDPEGSGLNASRLTGMSYGHESLTYSYDSGVDARISRLSGIDGARLSNGDPVRLEGYTYLGLSTVVARTDAEIGTLSAAGLTLIGSTTSALTGDPYVGLDTFGRIADQRWTDGSGSAEDEFQYAYDADSNPVARVNALSAANSEAYGYDALDRLTSFSRQTVTVSGSTTAPTVTTSGTASATQSWNYDSLGNWATMSFNGSTHSSTFNSQNQLVTNGPTSSTLAYDANGNTTTDENGDTLTYDAWNRMASWSKSFGGSSVETYAYAYDGLGRRISQTDAGTVVASPANDHTWVLSLAGQVLTDVFATFNDTREYDNIWSPVYVNAMVLRDMFITGSSIANALPGGGGTDSVTEDDGSTFSQRLYVRTDANFNVTSLVGSTNGTTWITVERDVYTPYGVRTVESANWTGASTGSTVGFTQGFQGGFYDAGSGLVLFSARFLEVNVGRWTNADPMGYFDGAALERFCGDGPTGRVDPSGEAGSPPTTGPTTQPVVTGGVNTQYTLPNGTVVTVNVGGTSSLNGQTTTGGITFQAPYAGHCKKGCDFIQTVTLTGKNAQGNPISGTYINVGNHSQQVVGTTYPDVGSKPRTPSYIGSGGTGTNDGGTATIVDLPYASSDFFKSVGATQLVFTYYTALICDGQVAGAWTWSVTQNVTDQGPGPQSNLVQTPNPPPLGPGPWVVGQPTLGGKPLQDFPSRTVPNPIMR